MHSKRFCGRAIRWGVVAIGLGVGLGLAAADDPIPKEACPGGPCEIAEVQCDLGNAPAQSEECAPGQRCKKRANACWGVHPFQVPIYGFVTCLDCEGPPA